MNYAMSASRALGNSAAVVSRPTLIPASRVGGRFAPLRPVQRTALCRANKANVRFSTNQHVHFREQLRIVGSSPELGTWDIVEAPALRWTEGDDWSLDLALPTGSVEYKLAIYNVDSGAAYWEGGYNRTLELSDPVEVALEWEKPESLSPIEEEGERAAAPEAIPAEPEAAVEAAPAEPEAAVEVVPSEPKTAVEATPTEELEPAVEATSTEPEPTVEPVPAESEAAIEVALTEPEPAVEVPAPPAPLAVDEAPEPTPAATASTTTVNKPAVPKVDVAEEPKKTGLTGGSAFGVPAAGASRSGEAAATPAATATTKGRRATGTTKVRKTRKARD